MDFLKPTIGNQVKHILIILSLFLFSLTIISCAKKSSSSSSDTTTQMGGSIQGVELSLDTVVTTLAGTGSSGSVNGTGTSASFYNPQGITTDGTNLYVAERVNHLIRKIVISTGAVTTVAGTGSSGSANGTGTSASFNYPRGITTDGTILYVADNSNHLIRKIVISTGAVTTLAGTGSSGSANGTGTSASFYAPSGITTDGTNLYVVDYGNHLIRQIVISTGVVTTLAGTGSSGSADNSTGTSASFYYPTGITTDGTNLYVADNNHLIRKIVISTGVVTTVAGTGSSGSANGTGTSASFSYPYGAYNDVVQQIVKEAGYRLACTSIYGTNRTPWRRFELRRIEISGADRLVDFRHKLQGKYDWLGHWQRWSRRCGIFWGSRWGCRYTSCWAGSVGRR